MVSAVAVTAAAEALFQQRGRGTAEAGGRGREFAFFGQPWAQAQSEDERDGVGRARGENSCLKMCTTAEQGP